ncbi:SGNH/GDSL hydrolase family protein [Nibrella saemangeumensis]|uniref:SGNH/GDSL hydrolase family protein n=1 Tax=Nibrella saemangeumensis TaxID=1084526 RepID=A0ABP8MYQ8_9BACT
MRPIPIILLLIFVSFPPLYAQPDSLAPARECTVRSGLPTFFQKLKSGQPVKIAYFGGSITEAGNGWREQSLKGLQQAYPKSAITHINAAIGGTGSDLGAFRLRQHVLDHAPDLVLVEFAVNDNGRQPDLIHRTMEGIVRQIWRQFPRTDIAFVYTLTAAMAPILEQGKLPASATAMEKVADYYGIPSIHMGLEVVKLAQNGKLVYRGKPEAYPDKLVFSNDNVHPYPTTGHRLYAEAFARAIQHLQNQGQPQMHRLPKPLLADNWERAAMAPVRVVSRSAHWQEITPATDTVARQLQNRFTYLVKANQAGAKMTIRFKGTQLGLYDVMGPGCGQYSVSIDGQPARKYPRFDEYCTYYRSNYFLLPELPDGIHTVELTLSDEPLDKAAILQKRGNAINDPRRYAENAGYASQVLLIGELVD